MSDENKNINNAPENNDDIGESNAAKRLRMLGISTEDLIAKEPIAKTNFSNKFKQKADRFLSVGFACCRDRLTFLMLFNIMWLDKLEFYER